MATYKILGTQVAPAANTLTTLCSGGASGSIVATFSACNTTTNSDTIRVAITPNGGSTSTANYIYYDLPIPAKGSLRETPGWTLASGDTISVYSAGGYVSFTATGSDI